MSFQQDIINASLRAGIPPAIALSVAQQESGVRQYWGDGSLIVGASGEIGMFQVKPATGAEVKVYDLSNPQSNIQAGVAYLKSMFDQTGSWSEALAAYNGGIGNWSRGTVSPEARQYSAQVMSRAPQMATTPEFAPSFPTLEFPAISYGSDPVFFAGVTEDAAPTALLLILGLMLALAAVRV